MIVSTFQSVVSSLPGRTFPKRARLSSHPSADDSGLSVEVAGKRLQGALRRTAWLWITMLGAGMVLGAILVGLVGLTCVVLPYDQAFVGLTLMKLVKVNPQLLPFMAHDRVTLAGVMLSLGVLYGQLAFHAIRQGEAWAMRAVIVSAGVGFASLFLFLGFGYFDPLHALVTVILFMYFLLGLRAWSREKPRQASDALWHCSSRLHLSLAQLLLLLAAFGIIVGGLTIATLGTTTVFVPEDLAFLHTTPRALHTLNERIIPLVAHDRAGFGGVLVADGLGTLLAAWWGVRPGVRWLWWTFLGAGVSAFVPTIGIHLLVGYTTFSHLLPALVAGAFYAFALLCSYSLLHRQC